MDRAAATSIRSRRSRISPPRPSACGSASARWGDGWMPMTADPASLAAPIAELRRTFADAGKPPPIVVVLTSLPLADPPAAAARARAFTDAGATGLVHATPRYPDALAFGRD